MSNNNSKGYWIVYPNGTYPTRKFEWSMAQRLKRELKKEKLNDN